MQEFVYDECCNCLHYDICPVVFEEGEWEICELHRRDPDMDLHNNPTYLEEAVGEV